MNTFNSTTTYRDRQNLMLVEDSISNLRKILIRILRPAIYARSSKSEMYLLWYYVHVWNWHNDVPIMLWESVTWSRKYWRMWLWT